MLLDSVPANGETWFLARAFDLLRAAGIAGVVSFSDPMARLRLDGTLVHPGHVGTIYQAFNATFLGRARAEAVRLLPDGTVLHRRAIAKLRGSEQGWRYVAARMRAFGADEPRGDLRSGGRVGAAPDAHGPAPREPQVRLGAATSRPSTPPDLAAVHQAEGSRVMTNPFLDKAFLLNKWLPLFAKHVPIEVVDFVTALPHEVLRSILGTFDEEDRDYQIDTMLEMKTWHAIARWAYVGMPVFQLTHGAAAAFALTDPSSVLLTDFRTPFPTFLISLPVPFLKNLGGDDIHAICWHEHDDRPLNETTTRPGIFVRGFGGPPDHPPLFAYILDPGTSPNPTLAQWLNAEATPMRDDEILDSDGTKFCRVITQMLMSFALYVTTHGRGQALSRRARTMSSGGSVSSALVREPSIWLTGREIKVDRELREAAMAFGDAERDPTQWKLRARFTVRGHWRNQACGPGHVERRMRWIAPYWKGPSDGIGIQHLYKTDE